MLTSVERVTGDPCHTISGLRREGDPPRLVANSDKLQQKLGWKPTRADLDRIVGDAWAFEQGAHKTRPGLPVTPQSLRWWICCKLGVRRSPTGGG